VPSARERPRHRHDGGLRSTECEPHRVLAGDGKPQRMDDDLERVAQSFCQSGSSVSVPVKPERVTETA
jgi:hypothetical protein